MEDKKVIGLIEELGLDNLSEKEKDDLIVTWAETLQDRISVAIMDGLKDEEREEFNKLAETAKDEEINKYLAEHVPDLDDVIQDEFESLREELREQTKQIREDVQKINN